MNISNKHYRKMKKDISLFALMEEAPEDVDLTSNPLFTKNLDITKQSTKLPLPIM